MKITMQMDRQYEIPVVEWEEFLAHARRAGAADDTPVTEDYGEDDPRTPSGFVITVEQGEPSATPENVLLPTGLVHDLIHIATVVARATATYAAWRLRRRTFSITSTSTSASPRSGRILGHLRTAIRPGAGGRSAESHEELPDEPRYPAVA